MFDVKYVQIKLFIDSIGANGSLYDIPIGPPLGRQLQVFSVRCTSNSNKLKFVLHTVPYVNITPQDVIYIVETEYYDETLNEVWLTVDQTNYAKTPYLFASIEEIEGIDPETIKIDMRITD
jgi:hypothetical protein